MPSRPRIYPAGDHGFFIRFGDVISPAIHERIFAGLRALDRLGPDWVTDCIPTYCTILLLYDDAAVRPESVRAWIEETLSEASHETVSPRLVRIPVWYDPEVGPDLEELARSRGLTVEQVIEIHTGPDYLVYMLGFKPGFPFMGNLDERLWTPRLANPRLDVAAGSVGIGGRQTGIYSVRSPGGWHILGRTPLRIFDAGRKDCFRILPGDKVRFFPVDQETFRRWEREENAASGR
jgi:inhibitor of KinA